MLRHGKVKGNSCNRPKGGEEAGNPDPGNLTGPVQRP